ncbi:MAG: two-component regulator propeller domain-containing protein [Rhodobacter sp.]|nr:two-component regulator propeller domain-containing protein [Rhodobacter sp.]
MTFKRILLISLLAVAFGTHGFWAYAEPIRFNSLTPREGLSQVTVYSILQAEDGRIWIGTADGIDIYDGHRIEQLRHDASDPNSLSVNYTRALLKDTDGDIWIGTLGGGLNHFHTRTGAITRYSPELPGRDVYALFQAIDGAIWIGTSNGISVLSKAASSFEIRTSKELGLKGSIRAITQDRDGRVWLGSSSDGICVLVTIASNCEFFRHDEANANSLSQNAINFIAEDAGGAVWIGTEYGGLNRLNTEAQTFTHFRKDTGDPWAIGDDDVTSMVEDDRGYIWFGTWSGGLNRFDPQTERFEKFRHSAANPSSPVSDTVIELFVDHSRQLWLGTYDQGVSWMPIDGDEFRHYVKDPLLGTGPGHNMTWALGEDTDGTIWIGTANGLNRFDRTTGEFATYRRRDPFLGGMPSADVRAILPDGDDLWLGTARGGLARLDLKTSEAQLWEHSEDDPNSLAHDTVRLILKASNGWLWIGTQNGVNRLNPETGEIHRYAPNPTDPNALQHRRTRALYEDSTGTIWIGTSAGVSRYRAEYDDFETFSSTTGHLSVNGDDVRALYENDDGTFWLATSDGLNLVDIDKGLQVVLREADGLPNDTLYSLIPDGDRFLWITTNNGLTRFDRFDRTFEVFKVTDGLQSNEFNFNAHLKASDGSIFVGGVNGFNHFDPNGLGRNKTLPMPRVVMTAFDASGEAVSLGESGALKPGSEVRFDLAALHYQNPNANGIEYRLLGLSDHWQALSPANGAVQFQSLPSGAYALEARFSNPAGIWTEPVVAGEFIIPVPMWQRWWALMLYTTALLIAGYALFRWRVLALENRAQKLQLAVDSQTVEIARQRDELAAFGKFREQFFRRVSHELRTPLALIRAPLDLLKPAEADGPKLSRARSALDRLERLTDQMLRATLGRNDGEDAREEFDATELLNSVLQLFALGDEKALEFQTDIASALFVRTNPMVVEDIVYNLISNAVKYAPAGGTVRVKADCIDDVLSIRVENSGDAIPSDLEATLFKPVVSGIRMDGFGVGLSVVHDRLNALGGKIDLAENRDGLVAFVAAVPVAAVNPALKARNARAKEKLSDSKGPILLVLEDDPDLGATLQEIFADEFRVLLAPTVESAKKLAKEHVPDVVLSDVLLPDGTGYEFLTDLRADEATNHIPFLFLTALAEQDERLRGLVLEANDYITKPFSVSELRLRVGNQLRHRARLQKWFEDGDAASQSEALPAAQRNFLRKFRGHLEYNYADPDFKMDRLVDLMGMSRRQLERKLDAITGKTFVDHLTAYRVERAKDALGQGFLVKEVSAQVGYRDTGYFSRVFENATGKKPSTFKKAG